MMRLPHFQYHSPGTVREAAELLAAPGGAMLVAGGTDLLPNMKRRQQVPTTLIGLRRVAELRAIARSAVPYGGGLTIGAGVTLTELVRHSLVRESYRALWQAASQVATPHLRNMGTLGGNLCLDTRCNYYDQNYEWRKAIGFCMKKDGDICLVAPGSPRCWAISSSDTAPMAIALDGVVGLTGPDGERELPVSALYRDDGIDYLAKQPSEVLTSITLSADRTIRTAYVKLRRRGSIDFPIAGAAVAIRLDGEEVVGCRIVLSAVASHPVEASAAEEFLKGKPLTGETIRETADIAAKPAKPLDNADLAHFWRKRMVRVVVEDALALATTRTSGSKVKLLGRNPD
jgi:4-hydroxybenzoyl-CoA reductase subunit beta